MPPTNANSAGGDGGARQACLEPSRSAGHNSLASPAAQQAAPKRYDGQLARYGAASRALAEARSVDEVKDIRDKAVAMAAYARQAKNRDLEADSVEIRMRATRRLDQLRQAQKETVGLNPGGQSRPADHPRRPAAVPWSSRYPAATSAPGRPSVTTRCGALAQRSRRQTTSTWRWRSSHARG